MDVPQWLLPHAQVLFGLSFWVNIALGFIILGMLGAAWKAYKWAAHKLLQRLDAQDGVMSDIRELLRTEIDLLKTNHHRNELRIAVLEEFKDQMQQRFHNYGRRITDQKFDDAIGKGNDD